MDHGPDLPAQRWVLVRAVTTQNPLAGVRVLDLSRFAPGGFCTPAARRPRRRRRQGRGTHARATDCAACTAPGFDAAHIALNRGKRSIALDLRQPMAPPRCSRRLVAWSDVVIDSHRPGQLDRFGLGYAAMAASEPAGRLVLDHRVRRLRSERRCIPVTTSPTSATPACSAGLSDSRSDPTRVRGLDPTRCHDGLDRDPRRAPRGEPHRPGNPSRRQHDRLRDVGPIRGHRPRRERPRTRVGHLRGPQRLPLCRRAARHRHCHRAEVLGRTSAMPSAIRLARRSPARRRRRRAGAGPPRELFATKPAGEWLANPGLAGGVGPVNDAADLARRSAGHRTRQPDRPRRTRICEVLANPIRFDRPTGDLSSNATNPPPGLGAHTDAVLREAGFTDDQVRQLHESGVVA